MNNTIHLKGNTSQLAKDFAKENNLNVEINQAYIDNVGEEYSTAENVAEAYQGEYDDDEDFARNLVDELGELPDLPNYIHIDWESTTNDLMMDYFEEGGYYFRNL